MQCQENVTIEQKTHSRSSRLEVFCNKGVLKNLQNLQENTCVRVFFGSSLRPATLLKETLAQVFSCKFCEILENTYFYRTPLVAASDTTSVKISTWMTKNKKTNWKRITYSFLPFNSRKIRMFFRERRRIGFFRYNVVLHERCYHGNIWVWRFWCDLLKTRLWGIKNILHEISGKLVIVTWDQ